MIIKRIYTKANPADHFTKPIEPIKLRESFAIMTGNGGRFLEELHLALFHGKGANRSTSRRAHLKHEKGRTYERGIERPGHEFRQDPTRRRRYNLQEPITHERRGAEAITHGKHMHIRHTQEPRTLHVGYGSKKHPRKKTHNNNNYKALRM
jgi:hypothetical protein